MAERENALGTGCPGWWSPYRIARRGTPCRLTAWELGVAVVRVVRVVRVPLWAAGEGRSQHPRVPLWAAGEGRYEHPWPPRGWDVAVRRCAGTGRFLQGTLRSWRLEDAAGHWSYSSELGAPR